MKKLNILTLIVGALIVALPFQGCETIELDLRENPNAVTPEQASPDLFLNAIQEDFAFFVESVGETTSEVVRLDYMFGRDYQQAYQPNSFDGEWSNAYAAMFEDIKTMNAIAEQDGFTYHIGVGQFIKAYTITALVDIFGDVPFSEANLGAENFNPNVDPGDQIYAAAIDLLDEAIANFGAGGPDPQNDFFYDGDETLWIKACNTLKLKLYSTTRLVDPTAVAKFNAIVSNPNNYISSSDEDMQFQWGDSQVQPDTRHPRYSGDYTATGAGEYQSIHQMSYMLENADPRIRYYFYRQNEFTPGEGAPPDLETLDCSLEFPPDHYFGFPFCNLPNGYWGRDHGNNDGIPPDTFSRTIHGVYPAGGKFDDNTFEGQGLAAGGGGAGITPILLASSVDFMRGELALVNGNTATAKVWLLQGLSKSVEKVLEYGSVDPTADLSFAPTEFQITAHAGLIGDNFDDDPEGGWNVLAQEYFTSLFGNGLEAYNFYRRTGFPTNLQPNLEANPGAFIRSFLYPANFVNNNSVVTQKATVTEQVFWDTNSPSPAFPEAN